MMPANPDLPLFAYGIFHPGQPAWFRIREHVQDVLANQYADGALRLREGLPILDTGVDGIVNGSALVFEKCQAADAYAMIAEMELDTQYRWERCGDCNVLAGRSPQKGSIILDEQEWDCWQDPCFSEALDVAAEATGRAHAPDDFRDFFRLQMAYLLLWSSIERLATFRHGFGTDVLKKVRRLWSEPAFLEAIRTHAGTPRSLQRSNDPTEKAALDRDKPDRAVTYYYQVRCNIAHRGKSMPSDHLHVRQSLSEVLGIFRQFLQHAQEDAGLKVA